MHKPVSSSGRIAIVTATTSECRFLGEIGTVSPAEQRKELFGTKAEAIQEKDAQTNAVAAPKARQTKKTE